MLELKLNSCHTLVLKSRHVRSSNICSSIEKVLATVNVSKLYKTCTLAEYCLRSIKIPVVAVHWSQRSEEVVLFWCPVLEISIIPVATNALNVLVNQHCTSERCHVSPYIKCSKGLLSCARISGLIGTCRVVDVSISKADSIRLWKLHNILAKTCNHTDSRKCKN